MDIHQLYINWRNINNRSALDNDTNKNYKEFFKYIITFFLNNVTNSSINDTHNNNNRIIPIELSSPNFRIDSNNRNTKAIFMLGAHIISNSIFDNMQEICNYICLAYYNKNWFIQNEHIGFYLITRVYEAFPNHIKNNINNVLNTNS